MYVVVILLLVLSSARAEREPADYRAELGASLRQRVESLNAAGQYDPAVEVGSHITQRVGDLAPVCYEVGFAADRLGKSDDALRWYDRAIAADPDLPEARYDRGELLLTRGQIDAAERDFEAAARLRPDHWAVHFRLAHIAGMRGDPTAFEEHLTDALREGFDFRSIEDDPKWKLWSRDPTLGPILERLIVVYSDESILDRLREAP